MFSVFQIVSEEDPDNEAESRVDFDAGPITLLGSTRMQVAEWLDWKWRIEQEVSNERGENDVKSNDITKMCNVKQHIDDNSDLHNEPTSLLAAAKISLRLCD